MRAATTTESGGNTAVEVSHDGSTLPTQRQQKFDVHREALSRCLEGSGENGNGGKCELHCCEGYTSWRGAERVV